MATFIVDKMQNLFKKQNFKEAKKQQIATTTVMDNQQEKITANQSILDDIVKNISDN